MGGTTPYLIDWLTLRLPISPSLFPAVYARVSGYLGFLICSDAAGEVRSARRWLDLDALRSDTPGLCWSVSGDGRSDVLVIGGSPASLAHGLNVWGSCDILFCASVLLRAASVALGVLLPSLDSWRCSRVDVTANYGLPDGSSVKVALQQLMLSSGARRRPSSHNRGGDTVYWNPSSDRAKGKAYHKGPQVLALWKRNKLAELPEDVALLDRVIRLEHTRGARWFRDLEEAGERWQDLTEARLVELHTEFFAPLVASGIEVRNMEKVDIVKAIMAANGCSETQALAAFSTYRNCRCDGFEVTRDSMSRRTFFRHQKLLRVAGISDKHLRTASLIPFPKVRFELARPVANWEELRRCA